MRSTELCQRLLATIVLLTSIPHANVAQSAPKISDLVIKNVTMISGDLPPRQNVDVVIEGDRIAAILPAGRIHDSAQFIDGRGKFLIPGLIDSHVHIGHEAIFDERTVESLPDLLASYRNQIGRSFLYHGFTSLIDLDLRPRTEAWYQKLKPAPALYHCGLGVRVAGGYGPSFVPAAVMARAFPNLVYEPAFTEAWPVDLDPADYTPAAAADRVIDAGGICLKAYSEIGFGGIFDWPTASAETLGHLSQEAKKSDLAFIVHANDAAAWSTAVEGNADILAHGLWHWPGDRRSADLDDSAKQAIADAVAANIVMQPTLRVVLGERSTLSWDLLDDPRLIDVLPGDVLAYLASDAGRWSQRELQAIYAEHNPYKDTQPMALIGTSIERVRATTKQFYEAGGRLIFGSDTPAQNGIGNPPGLNGHLEIQAWAEIGIPLHEIFLALTSRNAAAFHLEQEIGSIEPGMRADLLLLGKNPLLAIEAYDTIEQVVLSGMAIPRETLSAIVR